ncbi:helix-turn-helix domain-containing protein [Streptomyces sp. NPDC059382]|uniref:helix-turn-helix domain-containing protein n=1 Tax=Streptomyces sp. NPDC059382 TaxID=3346816 RepID=UPI0036C6E08E
MSNEAQTYVATLAIGNITAKFVLSRLADRADERFSCFPSVPLLAAEAEKSERVVQRALALLRELKVISDKERTRPDKSTASSRYYLHGPWDDYAKTGVPFPTITTPKQKRAEAWAEPPIEGEFRPGTAAAEALGIPKGNSEPPPAPEPEPYEGEDGQDAADDTDPSLPDTEQEAPAVPAAKAPKKAAAKKTSGKAPSKSAGKEQVRMTREQAAAVATVEAAWPAELAQLLPKYRPGAIRDAILAGLDGGRTPDQLVARVQRRWYAHGYMKDLLPGGKGIATPVGVAVRLVGPSLECPDPMCEDRVLIHTGDACPKCEQRGMDRRADHRAGHVPGPRGERKPGPVWWTCGNKACQQPGKGEQPADGLCDTCREAMLASTQQLAAELAAEEAERRRFEDQLAWNGMLEDAYDEHQEREDQVVEARKAAERERKRIADAEEKERIREEIRRQHPELAQYAQA